MNQFLLDSKQVDCNCMGITPKNTNKLFLARKKQSFDHGDFEPRRSAKSTQFKNQPQNAKNIKKSLKKQRPGSHIPADINYFNAPPLQNSRPLQQQRIQPPQRIQQTNFIAEIEVRRMPMQSRPIREQPIIYEKPVSTVARIRQYHRSKPIITQLPYTSQIANPFDINPIQQVRYVPINPVMREERQTISHPPNLPNQRITQPDQFKIEGFERAVKNLQYNPSSKISLSGRSSKNKDHQGLDGNLVRANTNNSRGDPYIVRADTNNSRRDPYNSRGDPNTHASRGDPQLSKRSNYNYQPQSAQQIHLRLAYSENGSDEADSEVIGKDFGEHLKDFGGGEKCSYLYDDVLGQHVETQATRSTNTKMSEVQRSNGLIQNIAQFGLHAQHQKSYQNFHKNNSYF